MGGGHLREGRRGNIPLDPPGHRGVDEPPGSPSPHVRTRAPEPVPQPREIGCETRPSPSRRRNCRSAPRSPCDRAHAHHACPAPRSSMSGAMACQEPRRAGESCRVTVPSDERGVGVDVRLRRHRPDRRRAYAHGAVEGPRARSRIGLKLSGHAGVEPYRLGHPGRRARLASDGHSPSRSFHVRAPASTDPPSPFVTTARTKAARHRRCRAEDDPGLGPCQAAPLGSDAGSCRLSRSRPGDRPQRPALRPGFAPGVISATVAASASAFNLRKIDPSPPASAVVRGQARG